MLLGLRCAASCALTMRCLCWPVACCRCLWFVVVVVFMWIGASLCLLFCCSLVVRCCWLFVVSRVCVFGRFRLWFVVSVRRVLSVACCLLSWCVDGWLSVVVCSALCGLLAVLTWYMLLLFVVYGCCLMCVRCGCVVE